VIRQSLTELDRWGIYANGAYTVGQLTILPGARYDITGTSAMSPA